LAKQNCNTAGPPCQNIWKNPLLPPDPGKNPSDTFGSGPSPGFSSRMGQKPGGVKIYLEKLLKQILGQKLVTC